MAAWIRELRCPEMQVTFNGPLPFALPTMSTVEVSYFSRRKVWKFPGIGKEVEVTDSITIPCASIEMLTGNSVSIRGHAESQMEAGR